jgi:tripartite-type tricarboxylate transporter receptor subunit TctC
LLVFLFAFGVSLNANAGEGYPTRTVKIVVPFSPGTTADPMARLLADELARRLGRPFVIDNRPGANGNIGAGVVARAEADGYTLCLCSSGTLAANPSLFATLPFNPLEDFAYIAIAGSVPNVLVVSPSIKVQTVPEFIAFARANPGELSFGSNGFGSSAHLAGELFNKLAGTDLRHIPYAQSSGAIQDLLAGRTEVQFQLLTAIAQFVREGAVKALVISAPRRSPVLPDVPSAIEAGMPGFISLGWFALLAPAATPKPILDRLRSAVREILEDSAFQTRYVALGIDPLKISVEEFPAFHRAELDRWSEVIRSTGAKLQ